MFGIRAGRASAQGGLAGAAARLRGFSVLDFVRAVILELYRGRRSAPAPILPFHSP